MTTRFLRIFELCFKVSFIHSNSTSTTVAMFYCWGLYKNGEHDPTTSSRIIRQSWRQSWRTPHTDYIEETPVYYRAGSILIGWRREPGKTHGRCARHERHIATNVVSVHSQRIVWLIISAARMLHWPCGALRPTIRYDFRRISVSSLAAVGSWWSIFLPRSWHLPQLKWMINLERRRCRRTPTHSIYLIYSHNLTSKLHRQISIALRDRYRCIVCKTHLPQWDHPTRSSDVYPAVDMS